MRDADARERLDKLEQSLGNLPGQIAEAVIAHFAPTLAEVSKSLEELYGQVANLHVAVSKSGDQAELLEVVEQELGALRERVETAVTTTGELSGRVNQIVRTFQQVGRTA